MKNKLTYIIDDDKMSVKLMTILMSKNNFCEDVHPFYNAQTALDKLKQNCTETDDLPDAILLDLNMPIMDGWQFLDEFILLPIKKEISIFIITSSIDPIDIEMAKQHDTIKDYIMKPITTEKLNALCILIGKIN
ncbi:response regulator [Flavobacterium sp. XS2P39]|uniref:response regulator n=1 Tax=Flavobacterium sp. XS2P39 TaxID=3401725 RepID=UPI003AAB7A87